MNYDKVMKIEEVATRAREVVREFNPEGLAPFPFEKIVAARPDLELFSISKLPPHMSGAIIYSDDKFTILINANKPSTRQYFTTAHEFGHYYLHGETVKSEEGLIDGDEWIEGERALYRLDEAKLNDIEREANNFAANLLMPEDLVKKVWQATESVEEAAAIFQVSVVAMSVRLNKLGLLPG